MLTGADLAVGEVRMEYSDAFDAGLVISQDVDPGSQVEEGSEIGFVVSLGPEITATPEPTPIPPAPTEGPSEPDPGTHDGDGEGGVPAG